MTSEVNNPSQAHQILSSGSTQLKVVKEHGWYGKRCIVVDSKKYRLEALAKVLSTEFDKVANSGKIDDTMLHLTEDTKVLLDLYQSKPKVFSVFGRNRYHENLMQKMRIINSPNCIETRKSSSIFAAIFPRSHKVQPTRPNPSDQSPIDTIRKDSYTNPAHRRALDHKQLTPMEVLQESRNVDRLAKYQMETEEVANFDEDFALVNDAQYNLGSKQEAKQLHQAILQIRQNEQDRVLFNGDPVDIHTTTTKLLAAIDSIPEGVASIREIHALSYKMLQHLESIVGANVNIQEKMQEIEKKLLKSLSKDEWIRIQSDFLAIKKMQQKATENPDSNEALLLEDHTKTLHRKIIQQAFAGIDFGFDFEDSDGRLASKISQVTTELSELAPSTTTLEMKPLARTRLDQIKGMPQESLQEMLTVYKLLLPINEYFILAEDQQVLSEIQKIFESIEERLIRESSSNFRTIITSDSWSIVDKTIKDHQVKGFSANEKAKIVRLVFDGIPFPQSKIDLLYNKILEAVSRQYKIPPFLH